MKISRRFLCFSMLAAVLCNASYASTAASRVGRSPASFWGSLKIFFSQSSQATASSSSESSVSSSTSSPILASIQSNSSIQSALSSMILQAEMDAWNSLSESDQNRMAKDVASIQASVTAQQVPVNGLVNGFTNDSIQARAYAYLVGRDQQPADANLQSCASFTLSRY